MHYFQIQNSFILFACFGLSEFFASRHISDARTGRRKCGKVGNHGQREGFLSGYVSSAISVGNAIIGFSFAVGESA